MLSILKVKKAGINTESRIGVARIYDWGPGVLVDTRQC